MDQNTQYVKNQLDAGVRPTDIIANLVASGWNETQATALVQQVSGVQLAQFSGSGYFKPPIILQILFALSIIGLLMGIFFIVLAVGAYNATPGDLIYRDKNTLAGLMAGVGAIYVAAFFLIRAMRRGSLLALKIYSVLVVAGIVLSYLPQGVDSFDTDTNGAVASNVVALLIVVYLWTRHRAYFR